MQFFVYSDYSLQSIVFFSSSLSILILLNLTSSPLSGPGFLLSIINPKKHFWVFCKRRVRNRRKRYRDMMTILLGVLDKNVHWRWKWHNEGNLFSFSFPKKMCEVSFVRFFVEFDGRIKSYAFKKGGQMMIWDLWSFKKLLCFIHS